MKQRRNLLQVTGGGLSSESSFFPKRKSKLLVLSMSSVERGEEKILKMLVTSIDSVGRVDLLVCLSAWQSPPLAPTLDIWYPPPPTLLLILFVYLTAILFILVRSVRTVNHGVAVFTLQDALRWVTAGKFRNLAMAVYVRGGLPSDPMQLHRLVNFYKKTQKFKSS